MSRRLNQMKAAQRRLAVTKPSLAAEQAEIVAEPLKSPMTDAEVENQELVKELAVSRLHIDSLHAAVNAVRHAESKQRGLKSVALYKLVDDYNLDETQF